MRLKFRTPFPLFAVITSAVALIVVVAFILEVSGSVSDSDKENVATCKDEVPFGKKGEVPQRALSFLASSERARRRFLKKVQKVLRGRRPSSMASSAVWNVFTPIYSCPHILDRIGTLGDGGKWVCGVDVFEATKDPCIVYSFGVQRETSFEEEMVNRANCTVYAFDHTVKRSPFPSNLAEMVHFSQLGIGSKAQVKENSKLATLKDLMDRNGHTWIDFLKIDVEGNEFEVFKDIAEDFEKFPFGHLNLEVHLGKDDAFGKMHYLWTILEKKGLRAFFWESNYIAILIFKEPFYMEFSFINVADSRNRHLQF